MVLYPFEGRLAHQTLGMLLTRRLDRWGAKPLGFVANDYGLSVWAAGDLSRHGRRRAGSTSTGCSKKTCWATISTRGSRRACLMKRTFRYCAVIAGLIERRHPGREKTGRQVTMSTDLVYDVLRKHEPGHILLEAAWNDAASGLLDIRRLGSVPQPHQRPNQASSLGPRVAAVRPDPSGDRKRTGGPFRARRLVARSGRRSHSRRNVRRYA